ncbi:hypothetical protein G4X40_20185 [Rhodococcus sp. D2-41]|uniref:major capsid protein n=1 Tax=Speluncibacter jeojiensis TaxID=2710754 RepID=UPI00240F1316|nr:major capsid protein [Rhodococcus sp. D2-41]MDG3012462.1 hypothetical protein [Rhodococcus sp. D2-41]
MADNPTSYPLGAPTVSGTAITVDLMLKEPTRINRYLSDLTLKKYFADRIFANGGALTGGAVVYSQLTKNDLFPDRDVQNVEPGGEFPIVTSSRQAPKVAQVEKFGGKFFVTDEARDRNDPLAIQQEGTKLANAIQRGIHKRALATLEASITDTGADVQVTGVSFKKATTTKSVDKTAATDPTANFSAVELKAEQLELGIDYNLWIVNPQEMSNFQMFYGENWKNVLANWNVDMIPSNIVTAGSAYVVAERQVGQMLLEKPLSTETWREEATERTWVQSSVRPVFAVTNPYSVLKVTGLDATA